jgi:hypothetical protein
MGITLAAPLVLPLIGAVTRPLAKVAIRGGLATAEALAPVVSGVGAGVAHLVATPWAQFQELVTEAQQERAAAAAADATVTEEILASTSAVGVSEAEQARAETQPAP